MLTEAYLDVYLINLDRSADRLAAMERSFVDRQRFVRVPATDGRAVSHLSDLGYDRKQNRRDYGRLMTPGEIGCYHSHLSAAKAFLETDEQYCVVLEDDAKVDHRLFELIETLDHNLHRLPENLNLLHLCRTPKPRMARSSGVEFRQINNIIVEAFRYPTVTTAFMFSRRGAETFIRDGSVIAKPVDQFFKDWLTRRGGGYVLTTPVVEFMDFQSDIGSGTARRNLPFGEAFRYDMAAGRRDLLNDVAVWRRKVLSF